MITEKEKLGIIEAVNHTRDFFCEQLNSLHEDGNRLKRLLTIDEIIEKDIDINEVCIDIRLVSGENIRLSSKTVYSYIFRRGMSIQEIKYDYATECFCLTDYQKEGFKMIAIPLSKILYVSTSVKGIDWLNVKKKMEEKKTGETEK